MSEPHVLTTLRRKRNEIEAFIREHEKKVKIAKRDLRHVHATIQLYEKAEGEGIRAYHDLNRLFRRGEIAILCKAALAKRGPLDTRELAQAVMDAKGFGEDIELRKAIAYRVVQALGLQVKRGTVGDAGMRKGVRVWITLPSHSRPQTVD